MEINDLVYGKFTITEPVILELINSRPLQRIKRINQAGSQLVEPHRTLTRYEHCIGVMLLLRKYNAILEEQIAGLLHDVPHTAFSHAVDFVFREGESQTYHERFLEKVILDSEIPAILQKYRVDTKKVLDPGNFSLLEQEIPELCADRIDYSLRDLRNYDYLTNQEIEQILGSIAVHNDRFIMTDRQTAAVFARAFIKACLEFWNSPKTLATFELMGDLLRTGLELGIIKEEDLFLTDDELILKISNSARPETTKFLEKLTPRLSFTLDQENFDYHTKGKARYIDPPILHNNEIKRLSEINETFSHEVASFKERVRRGHKIKIN